jgi:hypothetical protein
MARNSIPKFLFLIEHDARIEGAYERHIVEANNEDHAMLMVEMKDPDMDWGSGRFGVRVTYLGKA